MLNCKKERINFKKVLGKGAFGVVRPYQKNDTDTDTEQKWAVKIVKAFTFEDVLQCFKEITLGFSCDNSHVLPVKGYLIEEDKNVGEWTVYMKLPRMHNGSLRDVLNDYKKANSHISETKIAQYFYEMVCGLRYLHGKNIAHRDIKPENILFDENKCIKLADFGIGDIDEGNTSYAIAEKAGAVSYAAPENRDMNAQIHKKDLWAADLWSLGMVLFELCTQLELKTLVLYFSGEKLEDKLKEKLQELEKEGKYSKTLIELITSLLKRKPTERKSLRDVYEQLVSTYAAQLTMSHHSKEVQTEPVEFDQGLKARVQELEGHIQKLEIHTQEIEKNYKGMIADLENQLEKMQRTEQPLSYFEFKKEKNGMLIFPKEFRITNKAFKELAVEIGKLNSVSELQLNLSGMPELSDESVKKIAAQIGTNLKTLKSLRMSFANCFSISDESIKKFAFHIGTNLKTLNVLDLNFSRCMKISGESLKALALHLQYNLHGLQEFSLDFSDCPEISDEGVEELILQIATHIPTLRFLGLIFFSDQISDKCIKKLGPQLIKFKALEILCLAFANCREISDESVKILASHIGTNLKTLKEVTLNFSNTRVSQQVKKDIRQKYNINIL